MRRGELPRALRRAWWRACLASLLIAAGAIPAGAAGQNDCEGGAVYLTFDTGHMGVAPLVAEVLARQQVRVTFFAADERTQDGGSSLDEHWAPWWRARAAEGHAFASHTLHHTYWQGDAPGPAGPAFQVRPSARPRAGQRLPGTPAQDCAEIDAPAPRTGERRVGEEGRSWWSPYP